MMAYPRHPSQEKEEQKFPNIPLVQPDNTNPIPPRTNENKSFKRQQHYNIYHNQPNHPADLVLGTSPQNTNKGTSWPNHSLIGFYLIPANRTKTPQFPVCNNLLISSLSFNFRYLNFSSYTYFLYFFLQYGPFFNPRFLQDSCKHLQIYLLSVKYFPINKSIIQFLSMHLRSLLHFTPNCFN